MIHWKQTKLETGVSFLTKESGNSMNPRIKSGQLHELTPVKWEDCKKDDVVFCKVHGHYYTHLVITVDPEKGCLIGNNKGKLNGWTKAVFGLVTKIIDNGRTN